VTCSGNQTTKVNIRINSLKRLYGFNIVNQNTMIESYEFLADSIT